jgi:hypothetical protein
MKETLLKIMQDEVPFGGKYTHWQLRCTEARDFYFRAKFYADRSYLGREIIIDPGVGR